MSEDTEAEAEPPRSPRWRWERANRWLTLAANLGVLLGLIVLIVEVRQNAVISRTAMELQANSELRELEMAIARPDVSAIWMKSVEAPETLTTDEIRAMDGLYASMMLQAEQRFLMAKYGIGTEGRAREHLVNSLPFYFGSRFGKQWWAGQTEGWQGSRIIEIGDPIMAGVDENFLAEYYASLRVAPAMSETSRGPRSAARFTLLDLPREAVVPGIVRQRVDGVESTFSRWEIAAGGVVPSHSHINEQVTLLMSGAGEVVSGDDRFSLRPGDMLVLPPNVPHEYTFTEDSIVIEFFAPRRQDWIDAAGGRPNWAREP